jgi:Recombination endonuclease VII
MSNRLSDGESLVARREERRRAAAPARADRYRSLALARPVRGGAFKSRPVPGARRRRRPRTGSGNAEQPARKLPGRQVMNGRAAELSQREIKLARRNENARTRYAQDPEYRREKLESNRAYRIAHREEINERKRRLPTDPESRAEVLAGRRRSALRSRYGISLEEYERLLASQNGACAICEEKFEQTPCVDHCHKTGKVRGLLCLKCNTGLGCYDDDPARMLAATIYLAAARARNKNR